MVQLLLEEGKRGGVSFPQSLMKSDRGSKDEGLRRCKQFRGEEWKLQPWMGIEQWSLPFALIYTPYPPEIEAKMLKTLLYDTERMMAGRKISD